MCGGIWRGCVARCGHVHACSRMVEGSFCWEHVESRCTCEPAVTTLVSRWYHAVTTLSPHCRSNVVLFFGTLCHDNTTSTSIQWGWRGEDACWWYLFALQMLPFVQKHACVTSTHRRCCSVCGSRAGRGEVTTARAIEGRGGTRGAEQAVQYIKRAGIYMPEFCLSRPPSSAPATVDWVELKILATTPTAQQWRVCP